MNLWVKSLRQLALLAVVSFFFSCEDETSIGYPNPNNKINVFEVTIPLESSLQLLDSVVTDAGEAAFDASALSSLVGSYNDPVLGKVEVNTFLSLYPFTSTALESNAVYDSVTLDLRLNNYYYGFTGETTEQYAIHEYVADTTTFSNGNRYFSSETIPYGPEIATASITVRTDSLAKQATLANNRQDTILIHARLNEEYAQRLFDLSKNNPNGELNDSKKFRSIFRGLVIRPLQNNVVLGVTALSTFSQVTVHYRVKDANGNDQKQRKTFPFGSLSHFNINVQRTGELAGLQPYQPTANNYGTIRVVQSGAPVITRIDLANFYKFADTVENVLINEAQLIIENVESPAATPVHRSMVLRLMKENGFFAEPSSDTDSANVNGYYITRETSSYSVTSDVASRDNPFFSTSYETDKKRIAGFLSIFTQSLLRKKNTESGQVNPNRLRYLALYPVTPSMPRSIHRTIFNKDNIKLRLVYTRANSVTP